jgi:Dyp-type peroxidase family
MLKNLQGNILKGHGREHTWNIFFQFGPVAADSKRLLRELGNYHVTDAFTQLLATEAFKATGADGGTFCAVHLSSAGYTALGLAFTAPANNSFFGPGMKAAANLTALADPAVTSWDAHFQNPIHGMILIGDDDISRGEAAVEEIEKLLVGGGSTIHHVQPGKAIFDAHGRGLEHFGYMDGRSQPLLLQEDIDREAQRAGSAHWDPAFPLNTALVLDPLGADANAFGSFFIFRKLEQNVAGFKTAEQRLANALGLTWEDRERAGALVVGRFEDGTPVTMSRDARDQKTPPNDFNYKGDGGSRCPFHAHVRKTNPRGSGGAEPEPQERLHIMPRRGITYEDVPRAVGPKDLPEALTQADFETKVLPLLPTGGVGLLFMAYNSKLDNQFVFTQRTWANNVGFPIVTPPATSPGLDGVIGQGPNNPAGQVYPKQWDNPAGGTAAFDFKGFVTMKGGEYFFAPSIKFLRNL